MHDEVYQELVAECAQAHSPVASTLVSLISATLFSASRKVKILILVRISSYSSQLMEMYYNLRICYKMNLVYH